MAIRYIKGDVLTSPIPMIIHQCNAQDTMGSGVAKAIRDKYPKAYEDYIKYFELIPKAKRMGMIQITRVSPERAICNLIGQYHYLPRGVRHTSYDALTSGFEELKKQFAGDIAMPKIGCGLGGGDWQVVEAIINSIFNDRDVYIYEL